MKFYVAMLCWLVQITALFAQEQTITIQVNGGCDMCKDRIETVAQSFEGVISANWTATDQRLTITSDRPIDQDALEVEIAFSGHDTEHHLAPDNVYNALPLCCQVRTEDAAHVNKEPLQGEISLSEDGAMTPAIGATVQWLDWSDAVVVDEEGRFTLPRKTGAHKIVVSYVGYSPDTIDVFHEAYVAVHLEEGEALDAITVTSKKRTTEVSFINPIKVQQINEKELLKAACCNLSESFETTPSIDAANADAVTGIRQIRMLGLEGPNILLTRETMPIAVGINSLYELHLTPGPWIDGMAINSGIGSVLSGYDGHVGQIDITLKQPCMGDRLYLNGFVNAAGRLEGNLVARQDVTDKIQTAILAHAFHLGQRNDMNDDDYIDVPLQDHLTLLNRWKYVGEDGWRAQLGAGLALMENQGGHVDYREGQDASIDFWGTQGDINQYYGWLKIGKVDLTRPKTSLGFQLGVDHSDQDLTFGSRRYTGDQASYYTKLMYHLSLNSDPRHLLKMDVNGQLLQLDEQFVEHRFSRDEGSIGAAAEYSYLPDETFSLVAGLRVDRHNSFGTFVTPRFHLRKAFTEQLVWRVSAGRAQRTANLLSEALPLMASNRVFTFLNNHEDTPYGLDPTVAWSVGTSLTYDTEWQGRPLLLQADYYLTRFTEGVVQDVDESPQSVLFYNLDGDRTSHSFHVQADYELRDRWDVRLAYRFNDVRTDLMSFDRQLHPLQSRSRLFINTAYETESGWAFDLTGNWLSRQRLPNTQPNPEAYQLDEYSPDFMRWNVQITKNWGASFTIYAGCNNLFNFQQDNAVLAGNAPNSPFFDASMVWGPLFGRELYAGFRYRMAYD